VNELWRKWDLSYEYQCRWWVPNDLFRGGGGVAINTCKRIPLPHFTFYAQNAKNIMENNWNWKSAWGHLHTGKMTIYPFTGKLVVIKQHVNYHLTLLTWRAELSPMHRRVWGRSHEQDTTGGCVISGQRHGVLSVLFLPDARVTNRSSKGSVNILEWGHRLQLFICLWQIKQHKHHTEYRYKLFPHSRLSLIYYFRETPVK